MKTFILVIHIPAFAHDTARFIKGRGCMDQQQYMICTVAFTIDIGPACMLLLESHGDYYTL